MQACCYYKAKIFPAFLYIGVKLSVPVVGALSKGPGQGCALSALIAQSVQREWSPAGQTMPALLALNWLRGACDIAMSSVHPVSTSKELFPT